MKLIKALLLVSVLALMPTLALADFTKVGDNIDVGDADDGLPSVPEPSGALVMALGLGTVAIVVRRQRH